MRIILLPIRQSGENLKNTEEQQNQVSKMIANGWVHQGIVKIIDDDGITEIECVRLTKSGGEEP